MSKGEREGKWRMEKETESGEKRKRNKVKNCRGEITFKCSYNRERNNRTKLLVLERDR